MSDLTNVLLVDDNPKYLRDALPFYGYGVETAANGKEALKVLEKKAFDIVLLDVMMPDMDGWETLKAIKANNRTKNLPVIMVTAVNEEQKMVKGLKIGADDYIVKPFILPNLLARMEAVLRRSKRNEAPVLNFDMQKPLRPLTLREREILGLVAKGDSNKDIAEKLFLREVTVKSHLNNVFKKLKVSSRTQAILLGQQMDIIER